MMRLMTIDEVDREVPNVVLPAGDAFRASAEGFPMFPKQGKSPLLHVGTDCGMTICIALVDTVE
jgi:hypothetical protein